MANKPDDRNNAESTPNKGIRKVNLSDLKGSLSSRGRKAYSDPVLEAAMRELLIDQEPFIWEAVKVEGKTETEIDASKAKWRARAVSVFKQVNSDDKVAVSIAWTDTNEMVVMLRNA